MSSLFIILFIASVFVSSVSQVLLKKAADRPQNSFIKEYLNPTVIVAYSLFFISTLLTVFAYKQVPLSLGPVLESSGYIFVSILSYLIIKEKITKRQFIGVLLILIGIVVASLGKA